MSASGASAGSPAPFLAEFADAPEGASAIWALARDGKRLRLGQLGRGDAGTVLMLTGRTEYIEKYGRAARSFAARGYGLFAIDWRGQGLSERLLANPLIGHVGHFADYQADLQTLVAYVAESGAPRPWFMLGHSMGGAIGLRALAEGLDVAAAVFSAPLWGLTASRAERALLSLLLWASKVAGMGEKLTPSTGRTPLVLTATPEQNPLTGDPEMLDYMRRQLLAEPALGLAGPSLDWVREMQAECDRLAQIRDPGKPSLTILPALEEIVSPDAIRRLTAAWPDAALVEVPGARHEVMMERPELREDFFDRCADFFAAHGAPSAARA